ncbi:MAG: alanine racemase [Pseudomonadota bacterium]
MTSGVLTINLEAIAANWRQLDAASDASVETGATVKANAYSLGVAPVAKALAAAGARTFFVAIAEEGQALREALGPGPTIYVYSGHMPGDTEKVSALDLVPLLNSIEQITFHIERLPNHPFGVQLDTGMNRLGLEPVEWTACRTLVEPFGPMLVMSHLACGDTRKHPFNKRQMRAFREMASDMSAPLSLSATGGIFLGSNYHFDLTRPGIGLYGGAPFDTGIPAVTLSAPVIQVRSLAPGETVGYANTWTALRPTRLATLSCGYADGFIRAGSNTAHAYAGDIACPIVGRVSMDLITVDITDLEDIPAWMDLIGPYQGIDALAAELGTIGHEVLTSLGDRYARQHIGDV